MMDLSHLLESLEPLAVAEVMPMMSWRGRGLEFLEIRAMVLSPMLEGSDEVIRRGLYLRAEEIIRVIECQGWQHMRVPRIEFSGRLLRDENPPRIIHECEVRLEVTQ